MTESAYSTDNPEHVTAYRNVLAARNDWSTRVKDGVAALGAGPNIWISNGFYKCEITGIQAKWLPDDQGYHIPDGWRVNKDGILKPRRGKPGESARQWLAGHVMPDTRAAMAEHGLPREVWALGGSGGYRICGPELFEHDGVLWAKYPLAPSECDFNKQECTWTPRRLSELYAAKEAHEDAAAREKADVR